MTNEKNAIRSEIRRQAMLRSERWRWQASEAIRRSLERLDAFAQAGSVALYWSLPGEVFTHDLVERWSRSKRVYLPVMQGDGLILKRSPTGTTAGGCFGVRPSRAKRPVLRDAVDHRSGVADRQGTGSGTARAYDRLLREPGLLKAGVCFDYQMQERIPHEAHDVAMDLLVCGSDRNAELIECRRPRSETDKNA
ncbi:MAG: 5-formyltetrahydrofolate cyclo-ligase [Alistipes sp.]